MTFIDKYIYPHFFSILFLMMAFNAKSQELPILNQKLTNSYLYNPSLAGLNFGSVTLIHKKNYNDVSGSPKSNIASIHYPLAQGKAGIGLNYVNDQTNVFNNSYASLGLAYHILFSEYSSLSFGLSGDFSSTKADPLKIRVADETDDVINNILGNNQTNYDFSYGMDLRTKFFHLGGAYNRLSSSFIVNESESFLQDYITGYLNITLPLANRRDLLEPMLTYRKLSKDQGVIDAGAYFTYNDLFMIGGAYGTNNSWNAQVGLQLNNFYLGYVYENFSGKTNQALGSNNEFILRFDFSKAGGYKHRYATNFQKSQNAISYRRKTLSKPPVGANNPNKFNSKLKKRTNNSFNPNKRYNPKKLYTVKVKYPKKKKRNFKPPKN